MVEVKTETKINNYSINVVLLALSILAPATSLTLKFAIDLVLIFIFVCINNTKIKLSHFILLCFSLLILSFQDLQTKQLNNILEVGRLISVWLIFNLCNQINNSKVLILFLKNIMILAGIFTILNYMVLSDIMVSIGFNNLSFKEAYGRNSSIFATYSAVGTLSFLTIHFIARGRIIDIRTILALLSALLCLFASGSKTYILLVFIYILTALLIYFFKRFSIKNVVFYLMGLVAIYYMSDIFLDLKKFQVMYQLEKLLLFLQGNIPTSILKRLEYWESFLTLQTTSVTYLLFGVPKEVTDQIGNTFDSDAIFILVRFGLVVFILYLFLISTILIRFFRRIQFLDFLLFLSIIVGSLTLGVLSDVQSLALISIFIFLTMNGHEENEK